MRSDKGNEETICHAKRLPAVAMTSKSLGFAHRGLAISLIAVAALVSAQPGYAAPARMRQVNVNQSTSNQPDLQAMMERAEKLRLEGQFGAAVTIWQQILLIVEKTHGPDHPDVAIKLSNLALVLTIQGRYGAAEPLFRRSQGILEKAFGPDHPDVAFSLYSLAHVLKLQGNYTSAEPLYRRSLVILEKALGPDHPDLATSLGDLAMLLSKQGQYGSAEPLFRRSLAILEKALGADHPDVALILNNLAMLLSKQGQFAAAETLYRRSLAIHEKAFGPDHPADAPVLNNLALLLSEQGQYAAAETLYRRSLVIHEKAFGPDHPDVAILINNLALLLSDQGQYAAAETLYRRSLVIHEKAFGPDHPGTAAILNNLAEIFYHHGKYGSAELLVRRSLAIREGVLGVNHPDVATTLGKLAFLLGEQGQHSRALIFLDKSEKLKTSWYLRELPLLPDRDRSAQLRQLADDDERMYIFDMIAFYPPAARLALETRLNRQGLLRDIERRQALLLNSLDVDRIKVKQLQALGQQLASITLPIDRRAELGKQRDKLQAEIYRQIPELQPQLVTTAEVVKALPADGALVEFQRYQPFDGSKQQDQRWGAAQYIALVLKPNGSISAVPLGPAAAIDAQVHKGLRASADGLSDAESIWAQLSIQLLKPLLPQLTGSHQWFLSPDGELHRVPFAALPAPQQMGTPLAQVVQLRLLTTGRELVRLQQPAPPGSAALVMANPNYDRPSTKQPLAVKHDAVATVSQRRSAEMDGNQWKPLPASESEGQKVAKLLATGLTSGAAATTKALQLQRGPRVLHIATHGFFVADQETKPTEAMRAIQEGSPLLRSLRQEDPQLRSGLVFAGANQPDLDPNDDGYLTAAEAAALNLKGTELVVLSACSTGQGDVRTGEGVYGLQRSLTVSGARSTLLSLWKVDDAATAEFMDRYYQRLKFGEGRSDALAAVQAEFRSGKVQSPSGINWKEPYYWASWQLVGDWRSINGLWPTESGD
jgi:CHAT domain-containing protein/Tfp pilus assembly protein PilF